MASDPQSPGPVLTVQGAPLAFHLMAKPTGATCNLDCGYCFFLSKEMLYPGSRFRMARDLQETYIRRLLEAHARAPGVVVAWQGGEPTMMMGLDFFRRSIELQRAYARPGRHYLCPGYQAFFRHIREPHAGHGESLARGPGTRRADGDLRPGRLAPTEQRTLHLSRGNGRKRKHCHGAPAAA